MADAAPESSLSNIGHDLCLSVFKHADNLGEGRADVRVRVPAAGHDLTENREAISWDDRTNTSVDNSKCSLNGCHVLEGQHACDQLPEDNTKAVNINLLIVRSVLDHLSVKMTMQQMFDQQQL